MANNVNIKGFDVVIDDSLMPIFNSCKWYIVKNRRTHYLYNGKQLFHRIALGVTDSNILVDHKDGNGLNNSLDNLRTCTRSQNGANRRTAHKKEGQFFGIFKARSKYRASLTKDGISHKSRVFTTQEEAAKEYDRMAMHFHGAFAKTNF